MGNITIQTSQNIALEQTPASIGERIAAAGLDFLFYFIYFISVSFISGIFKTPSVMAALMFPVIFYHLVCEAAMNGQSFGKRIVKIKVVMIDGTPVNFMHYFIRWTFRLVDVVILFGAISTVVIILNGKGQRLGDIVANTTVIRIKEPTFNDTIYTQIATGYSLVFQQVSRLGDRDIYTAKEVLDFLNSSQHSTEAQQLALNAKHALESKMGIESDMQSGKFLVTVIRDYNFIHSR
jgi:uncharacterized RDD family membrane protein YckC